jgi:two-component system OmpR family response regulator
MTSIRVLLVDDEEDFREPTLRFLSKTGMAVLGAGSACEMDIKRNDFAPDVIILDVNMPGESGFDVVKRLRRETDIGLVLLTARGDVDDRVFGLNQGADNYLTKPVNLRELEAVIRGIFGRLRSSEPEKERGWLFDAECWTLTAPDGKNAKLSAAEYRVLAALMAEPGQPVARDILFNVLGRIPPGAEDRSLDVLVSRLRRKFSDSNFAVPIQSVRNIGYVFPRPAAIIGNIFHAASLT